MKGYKVIASALQALDDSRSLAVQFEIEQSRLSHFVRAVGLRDDTDDVALNRTLLQNKQVLLDILLEINLALIQFAHNEEFPDGVPLAYPNPNLPSALGEGYNSLSERLRRISRRPPESLGVVRSLTWSVFRKKGSEKILQRLGRFNDFLHELLETQQLHDLQDQQRQEMLELVQMQTSLDAIRQLAEGAQASRSNHTRSGEWQHTMDAELENLAAFKALYTSLLTTDRSQAGNIRIDPRQIQMEAEVSAPEGHPRAIYTIEGNKQKAVWINWQVRPDKRDATMAESLSPVEQLTILLMASKPDEFCIPTCLGYTSLHMEGKERQSALVFENPAGIDPKPSLTHRVILAQKIAQCLLYLHAVNWLHKALRSSNILLFPQDNAVLDVRSPYITGFDNSRRSIFDESTTEVSRDGNLQVYRHPDTQPEGPRLPYRKTFDIYSLGLILMEIAFWKPMVSIMGIEATVDRYPTSTLSIQQRLLSSEPEFLQSLRAEVGDRYAEAVETCLKGRDAFGVERKDTETSANTGIVIQREFNARVVMSLPKIVI